MKGSSPELQSALKRLEISAQKIIETRGYTKDAGKVRLLEELIREQLQSENTRSATRTSR
jgi:hypothetical protein